jgi:GDSL-like Lipase/Acylhydrolase family
MQHLVLLGDSVFDNAAYVADGPDVVAQLRALLPKGWDASLNAADGAVTSDIGSQLLRLPAAASHLVVSSGGNDALGEVGVLDEGARSVADALVRLTAVRDRFREGYRRMLDDVADRSLPTAICTIYEPRFPDPDLRKVAATALTVLNDVITREAFARAVTLIDLRLICDSDDDFANPIEPSVRGGAKIARAIARFAQTGVPSVITD